jgi:2,5-furandicarboxylate decarboxylase 1
MMQDLRSFIAACEKRLPREFVRITKEVDSKYEITAIVKKVDLLGKSPMILFENVKGYPMSVVCNTDTDVNKFALAFGVTPDRVNDFYAEKEEEAMRLNKYPCKEIGRKDAPCKEVVLTGKKASMHRFPFLVHHGNEVPYLTRAVGIVTDEKNNIPHTAHYRFMVKEPYLGVTHITPGRHFWDIYNRRMEQKKPLEIAFAMGLHPAVGMATQSRISHPPSEFDLAGGLLGESLEMVRCETIDVLVPADAEIVIEGEIPFNTREPEGPWGDFTRYHQVAERHPVKIKAITHRKNPIIHDMGAWPSVGGLPLVRIPAHAFMNRKIKEAVPDVKRFLFLPEVGWFYGFIQLDKKHAGQPKQAILAAFANELYLKYVAVFDTDIDIENSAQMAWALATRVQADRDLLILPGILGTDLDLSAPREGIVTKVGIDATAKPFRKDLPPEAGIPDEVMKRIDLKEYIPDMKKYL